MALEMIYTSAPRGLAPGSQGFCAVAVTKGMSATLVEKLEALAGYKPLYPPNDPQADRNPITYLHLRIAVAGQQRHVVGRVGPAGLDYTGRSNKIAHFVVLDDQELPSAGPAWLMRQPGFFETAWHGPPRQLEPGKPIPNGRDHPGGHAWEKITGDRAWANSLANIFQAGSPQPHYLVFEPGHDALALIGEALAVMPPAERWRATFSTYYVNLPAGVSCAVRGVAAGSAEAKAAMANPDRAWVLGNAMGRAPASEPHEPRAESPSDRPSYASDSPMADNVVPGNSPVAIERRSGGKHLFDLEETPLTRAKPSRREAPKHVESAAPTANRSFPVVMLLVAIFVVFAAVVGIEAVTGSSVARLVGVKDPAPTHDRVVRDSGVDNQREELEQKLIEEEQKRKAKEKTLKEMSDQLGKLHEKLGPLEKERDDAVTKYNRMDDENAALKNSLNALSACLPHLIVASEQLALIVDRAVNPPRVKIIAQATTKSKRTLLVDKTIAAHAEKLVPEYLDNPEKASQNQQLQRVNLATLLGVSALDKDRPVALDFAYLAPKALGARGGEGTALTKKQVPDGKLQVIFGDNGPVLAEFAIDAADLTFRWVAKTSDNQDIRDARAKVKHSVIKITGADEGSESRFVTFMAPKLNVTMVAQSSYRHPGLEVDNSGMLGFLHPVNDYLAAADLEALVHFKESGGTVVLQDASVRLDRDVVVLGENTRQGNALRTRFQHQERDSSFEKVDISIEMKNNTVEFRVRQIGKAIKKNNPKPTPPIEPKNPDKDSKEKYDKEKRAFDRDMKVYKENEPKLIERFGKPPTLQSLKATLEIGGARVVLIEESE